uniref:MULE transposase domain-containing protein n=1 Tax=Lactuca sativa TaxID=4236 RepID=A0A9R1XDD1_LACSA|nr:hypothetical protein LSAT_V11C400191360 [Lactuca sativa]
MRIGLGFKIGLTWATAESILQLYRKYIFLKVFTSRDELMEWVQNIAFSLGYVIVMRRSKAKNGVVSYITLICDRGREYESKATIKNSGTKKINCNFQLVGSYIKQYGGWTFRVICDQHNHSPAQYMEGHAFARRLKEHEKQLVADLTNLNVTPHDILSIIKERDENNVSTLKTIYNERLKLRSSWNYGKTPMQVLMEILNEKHFVTDFSVNSISNELENLFFIHPRSLNIWKAFPHVLIIDATYKTNKYGMPFVQIVGTTSTNKTFSIAFAFIVNEKEENYNWVLTCLKSTLEKCMHPRVIVTDRELALMNACQQVFPGATRKHWRRTFKIDDEWKAFRIMWIVLVDSPTWIVYNENYKTLQSMLRNYQDVLNYLDEVWLNKYKEMFVSVWIDQHLNFGQRTTNRVESAHSNLKKYLEGTNSSLDKFIGCLDQFVRSQLPSIHDNLEKSRIVRKREHNLPCFTLLWGSVSHEALDKLVGELYRLNENQIDSSNCGCKLQHSCGLPCACMLLVYLNSANEDIRCEDDLEMIKENFYQQSKAGKKSMIRRLRDLFLPSKTRIKDRTVHYLDKTELSNWTIWIGLFGSDIRIFGLKQQQKQVDSTNQAPRRRSYSTTSKYDGLNSTWMNKEPARHSSYVTAIPDMNEAIPEFDEAIPDMNEAISEFDEAIPDMNEAIPDLNEAIPDLNEFMDLNQEPESCYIHPLMDDIPPVFHPYVSHIQNVEGDGYCGFRAISVCLGYGEDQWLYVRKQLVHELESAFDVYATVFTDGIHELWNSLYFFGPSAPTEHWMLMPETGILIANRFGVILTFLTNRGSLTFFPLWKGPEEFLDHRIITISLIRGPHYVMVQLKEDCPMPTISALWIRHRALCTAG